MKKFPMKYLNRILLLLFLPLCLFSNEKAKTYMLGLDNKILVKANYEDAKVALSLWISELGEKENLKIKIAFYKNQDKILEDFKNKKLDIIIKDVVSYLRNSKKIDENSDFLWTLSIAPKSNFYSNLLIVKKQSDIKSLSDIEGKTISIKDNDSLARLWLDTLTYKELAKPYKALVKDELKVTKLSHTVLNIIFNKSDVAIVSSDTWNTMNKFNPSISKQVKILVQSKPIFIPLIGATREQNLLKNKKDLFFNKFIKTANRVEEGIHLKQIRTLIKFQHVYILKKEDLKSLFDLYAEYLNLSRK